MMSKAGSSSFRCPNLLSPTIACHTHPQAALVSKSWVPPAAMALSCASLPSRFNLSLCFSLHLTSAW